MKRKTRIIFAVIAWFVCHFTLHITFATGGMDHPDMMTMGVISVVNTCMAASVYFLTGLKNREDRDDFTHKEIEKYSGKKSGEKKWYW
ncbi:MAG: hypothetical protein K9K87_09520, partial [Desulfotignum sp.]|nr:hypothetical protein [Desulfotignum sp.]